MCRNRARATPDLSLRGALLAALFFVGSSLGPLLHLAVHDDRHDHVGGGLHLHGAAAGDADAADEDEDHGLVEAAGGSPRDAGPTADHQHRRRPGVDHGDGSLLHFGLALGDGAPAPSGLVDLTPLGEVAFDRLDVPLPALSLRSAAVRGPPALLPV